MDFKASLVPASLVVILKAHQAGCSTCVNGRYTMECEYGCCGDDYGTECCSMSTSVLVVACVVSGLVLIAVLAVISVCCYRNYRDKQLSRVRTLNNQQDPRNGSHVRRVVEPPKPPPYISAPPEYSEQMPESHFRPQTVTGHLPANQRFRATPVPHYTRRRPPDYTMTAVPGAVTVSHASGQYPHVSISTRGRHQGATVIEEEELPPSYSDSVHTNTTATRRDHRRFIRTPTNAVNEVRTINSIDQRTGVQPTGQSENQPNQQTQRAIQEDATASNVPHNAIPRVADRPLVHRGERQATTREQSAEDSGRVESRAESVVRTLRPSRLASRENAIPRTLSRQHQANASGIAAQQTQRTFRENNVVNRSESNITEEEIEDLGVI